LIIPAAAPRLPYGSAEAEQSADFTVRSGAPGGREIDLAIASIAIVRDAALWTLNVRDLTDIPGLWLVKAK
jgi:predicted nucleic acid-binding protein